MGERVCAVIVTYNRKALLRECLKAVFSQTRPPDHVLVVDNASTDGTPEMLQEEFPQVEVLRLPENQGGAGGFHEGMKRAYEQGFDWLWLMDDDALPSADCLEKLLKCALEMRLDGIAPLVIDAQDPNKLSFSVQQGFRRILGVTELKEVEFIADFMNLFNGALLRSSVINEVGLPRKELFVRGDEVDFLLRMRKSKLRFGTLTAAKLLHPSGLTEEFPLLGRRMVVVYTPNWGKNYYQYRNRVFLIREHKTGISKWLALSLEFIRHTLFFLLLRRSFKEWRRWLSAALDGYKGRLGCQPEPPQGR